MHSVLVIHGPNLNRLGQREPQQYGTQTLDQLNTQLLEQAQALQLRLEHTQSNHEGVLIDRIHQAADQGIDFIIINPGALTHSSIALRDALLAVSIPCIEVHLSNIYRRESFRQHSYIADIALGSLCGLGALGYVHALHSAAAYLAQQGSRTV